MQLTFLSCLIDNIGNGNGAETCEVLTQEGVA